MRAFTQFMNKNVSNCSCREETNRGTVQLSGLPATAIGCDYLEERLTSTLF